MSLRDTGQVGLVPRKSCNLHRRSRCWAPPQSGRPFLPKTAAGAEEETAADQQQGRGGRFRDGDDEGLDALVGAHGVQEAAVAKGRTPGDGTGSVGVDRQIAGRVVDRREQVEVGQVGGVVDADRGAGAVDAGEERDPCDDGIGDETFAFRSGAGAGNQRSGPAGKVGDSERGGALGADDGVVVDEGDADAVVACAGTGDGDGEPELSVGLMRAKPRVPVPLTTIRVSDPEPRTAKESPRRGAPGVVL